MRARVTPCSSHVDHSIGYGGDPVIGMFLKATGSPARPLTYAATVLSTERKRGEAVRRRGFRP